MIPAYQHIRDEVEREFGLAVQCRGAAPPKPPAYKFEVSVEGKLVHSYVGLVESSRLRLGY